MTFSPEDEQQPLLLRRRYSGQPWTPWNRVRPPGSRTPIHPDSPPGLALAALLANPLTSGVKKVTFKFAYHKVQYKLLDKS